MFAARTGSAAQRRDDGLQHTLPRAALPLGDGFIAYRLPSIRQILATGLTRLRGKIKYRPVVFELMPDRFTLSALQRSVEGILGLQLHTQNFRRALDKAELVAGTGQMETGTGGRPAELFTFRRDHASSISAPGLATPRRSAD